jgi:hypothetical protein
VPLNISFPSLVNVTPSADFKGPLLRYVPHAYLHIKHTRMRTQTTRLTI